IYDDEAMSGHLFFRRFGLQQMLRDAEAGKFNVLVVENLDRLARNNKIDDVFEDLEMLGIKILSQDGWVDDMHVMLNNIRNKLWHKQHRQRVQRGQRGSLKRKKFHGGWTYGYRQKVLATDSNGKVYFDPGEREIDPDTAIIVVRIFIEYAQGKSPREIAAGLTRDGIPSPSMVMPQGKKGHKKQTGWNHQVITGGWLRTGILGNRLYIGEREFNKTRAYQLRETEVITKRARPEEDWQKEPFPHL